MHDNSEMNERIRNRSSEFRSTIRTVDWQQFQTKEAKKNSIFNHYLPTSGFQLIENWILISIQLSTKT